MHPGFQVIRIFFQHNTVVIVDPFKTLILQFLPDLFFPFGITGDTIEHIVLLFYLQVYKYILLSSGHYLFLTINEIDNKNCPAVDITFEGKIDFLYGFYIQDIKTLGSYTACL